MPLQALAQFCKMPKTCLIGVAFVWLVLLVAISTNMHRFTLLQLKWTLKTDLHNACFTRQDIFKKSTLNVAGISKIYVIHWSKLTHRKNLMIHRLGAVLPVNWQEANFVAFVHQRDAENVTLENVECMAGNFSKRISRGTFSVTAKHHVAYNDINYHSYNVSLIIEDDVDFEVNFTSRISQVIEMLPTNWSNCFVSDCTRASCKSGVCLQPRGTGSNCAFGYLMSLKGASQMIGHLPFNITPDWQMNYVSHRDPAFLTYFASDLHIIQERPVGGDGLWNQGNNTDLLSH